MRNISWNEIQNRASQFAAKWEGETYEKGESQSFWSDFLAIFGVDRKRHGAYFEYAIKKLDNKQGFIDMFWPGKLLAEQKSAGRDLSAANIQAFDYLHNMPDADLPQFIIVSDFANFQLINLETREQVNFSLEQLPKMVKSFGFIIGVESHNLQEEDPVNRKAAEAMARLHNQLEDNNFSGHELELLLVRLVFCLFADDAGIFERGIFEQYLKQRTNIDGSDVGSKLGKIFEVLNTPQDKRQLNLDQDLAALPYVNGGLFAELTRMPDFTSEMRKELVGATNLNWSLVSPAIFGSMFQGVMDVNARRNLGAHYTSERNILKLIKPLFLDELYIEFESIRHNKKKLIEFHDKLANLTFLDPACGCGNFLVITYRELRKLEHKVLGALHGRQSLLTDVTDSIKVNVDQMYGIEIEEFPALIAETALWLTDHQMNLAASQQFGHHFVRLPLTKRANISNVNALTTDWKEVVNPQKLNYILGNPPFIGQTYQSKQQKSEMANIFRGVSAVGVLDFVSAWYKLAVNFIKGTDIEVAFVSTNSITQGEQVAILWPPLVEAGLNINFAHRTFRWSNEGKSIAKVFCVIIGFSLTKKSRVKKLYTYETVTADPVEHEVKNINTYLVDAPTVVIGVRTKPICNVQKMRWGNKPTDGGSFILSPEQKGLMLKSEPESSKFIRKYVSGKDFINNLERYCLWLEEAEPSELRKLPSVMSRVEMVRDFRLQSKAESTRKYADYPTKFRQVAQPKNSYLAIPEVSSQRRKYIPMAYFSPEVICSNTVQFIENATLYDFGVLTSQMHMAWMRSVAGRLKNDYRYSNSIVYNNFPWPTDLNKAQQIKIEELAQKVLDVRNQYPESSLADLYDPRTMPELLVKAHESLDKAVDEAYGGRFSNDIERVEMLLKKYTKLLKT